MFVLDSVSCTDAFPTDGQSGGAQIIAQNGSNGGYASVITNDVYVQVAYLAAAGGSLEWTPAVHVGPGNIILEKGTRGIRFRNYTAGKVAVVSAGLSEPLEPALQLTSGGVSSSGSSGGGVFTVGATIAALGTPSNGSAGLLELGSVPPGEFLIVVFDAALNKWVSSEVLIFDQGTATSGFNTIGETDLFASGRGLHDFRDYVNAALTPQFRTLGLIGKTSAIANATMTLGMQLGSQNAGTPEASIGAYGATFGTTARTVTGANIWQFDTGWSSPAALPTTADELTCKLRGNVSDGSDAKSWSSLKTYLRWVG